MQSEPELERACQIAGARLGVAEELRWPLAMSAAINAQVFSNSWLVAVGIAIAVYILTARWYDKDYESAWDQYEKATKTGKYYVPHAPDDTGT